MQSIQLHGIDPIAPCFPYDSVTSALSIVAIVVSAKPSNFLWSSSPKSCPWFLVLIAMAPPVATAISALVMKEGVTCGGMSPMAMRHWWCWLGKLVEAWATRCDWPGAKVMGRSVYAQQAASSHPRATHHCATKVPNTKRFWTARVMLCTLLNNYMWSAFHHLCYPEDSRRSWGSLPWERQEPGEPSSQIVACCLTTTWPATVCLQWSAHSQMLPFIATSLAANFAALLQTECSSGSGLHCIALEGTETKCRLGFFRRTTALAFHFRLLLAGLAMQATCSFTILSTWSCSQTKCIGVTSNWLNSVLAQAFTCALHHPAQRQQCIVYLMITGQPHQKMCF